MSEQQYQNTDRPENTAFDERQNEPGHARDYRWSFEDYEAAGRSRRPRRGRWLGVLGVILVAVLIASVIGLSLYGAYSLVSEPNGEEPSSAESDSSPQEESADTQQESSAAVRPGQSLTILEGPGENENALEDDGLSTVEIVKKVRPCVVGVTIYTSASTFTPAATGSGIVMDAEGYIITNEHVVNGASGINVELDNGDTYAAQLIGSDSRTDLAVIKIEADGLVPAQFGSSDNLLAGERVVAIGNPGGSTLAGSVTQGIVSATNRAISSGTYATTFIQTDAAINPGNSGGALINIYGQVVGINSAKIANVDYEGIGFAIPINEAKPVIDDLIEYGYVKDRAKIGISGEEINEGLAQMNDFPTGIYIWSIDPESDLAGRSVTKGDIITHIDGGRIETFADISEVLKSKRPGDVITLTLYRSARGVVGNGETFDVTISLMEDVG